MINLAGVEGCDDHIERELKRARIDVVRGPRSTDEVRATLTGALGAFRFRRAWRYWVVLGRVPLAVAQRLYADPVGSTDIRVVGHCACPAPERPWLTFVAPDGKEVVITETRHPEPSFLMARVYADIDATCHVVDDPAAYPGVAVFVDGYHIDTEVGIRLFVDVIREEGLAL